MPEFDKGNPTGGGKTAVKKQKSKPPAIVWVIVAILVIVLGYGLAGNSL